MSQVLAVLSWGCEHTQQKQLESFELTISEGLVHPGGEDVAEQLRVRQLEYVGLLTSRWTRLHTQ